MPKLHVLCARDGMHRGGRANPLHAERDVTDYTAAQLHDLVGDPNCRVVVGGDALTHDAIAALFEAPEPTKKGGK